MPPQPFPFKFTFEKKLTNTQRSKTKKQKPIRSKPNLDSGERERETKEELTRVGVGGRGVAWVFTLSLTVSLFFIVCPLLLLSPDRVCSRSGFIFLVWDGKCNVSKLLLGVGEFFFQM
jgi:hypothetical protein